MQSTTNPVITIESGSAIPVSRQIAEQLRQAILGGQMALGTPLPSVREYADILGVSRSTVSRAVEELASQGYVIAEQGSGTRVADHLPGELPELFRPRAVAGPSRSVQLTAFGNRLMNTGFTTDDLNNLIHGRPANHEGLLKVWKELLHRHSKLSEVGVQEYVLEPFGYEPLREAYASYLIRARAVRATKEQIAVFNAKELRIDMICRMLIKPGDVVAVEDPGYVSGRKQYMVNGARILPVRVDKDGMVVDDLIEFGRHEKIKLVHVTPSHHSPTGAVLSVERRQKLLRWAAENQVYIVEDDYDSEFRYEGRPLPSLQGMDEAERVIYISCLWRLISPVCRLGFLTVPPSLVSAFRAVKGLFERDVCIIDQLVLTDYINEGHLERAVRRLRGVYSSRREAALNNLRSCFGESIHIAHEASGLEMLIRFRDAAFTEQAVVEAAAMANLELCSTAPYYIRAQRGLEYVLSFAQLTEVELAEKLQTFAGHLARLSYVQREQPVFQSGVVEPISFERAEPVRVEPVRFETAMPPAAPVPVNAQAHFEAQNQTALSQHGSLGGNPGLPG